MAKISIIVPVYNVEKYLGSCIESILSQSFTDFELLLIDDGSKDRSIDICDKFLLKDCRVRVFHKENGGVTAARYDGVRYSKSDWLIFVDADDRLNPNALETLWNYHEEADLINASFVGSNGRHWIQKKIGQLDNKEYLQSILDGCTFGVVYACLYKKELMKDSTFSFGKDIKIGEDVLMKMEIASRVKRVLNLPDEIYWYRNNDDSVMSQNVCSPTYLEKYFNIRNSLISVQQKDAMVIKDLQRLLQSFYNPAIPFKKIYRNIILQKYNDAKKINLKELYIKEKVSIYFLYHVEIIVRLYKIITYTFYLSNNFIKKKINVQVLD